MVEFWLCFVPLFVAVDVVGVLPLYIGMTGELERRQRQRILFQSLVTACVVAFLFLAAGPVLLKTIGVTVSDFMVAGGILLLVLSLTDMATGEKRRRAVDTETMGAVPIGVPLITGPAVLTTSLLLANEYGIFLTGASLLLNIAIAGIVFAFAEPISRILGNAGSRILSKVASLFMASIAVMLVRKGIITIIRAAAGG
jgi:multiple antibiotic resistance protein